MYIYKDKCFIFVTDFALWLTRQLNWMPKAIEFKINTGENWVEQGGVNIEACGLSSLALQGPDGQCFACEVCCEPGASPISIAVPSVTIWATTFYCYIYIILLYIAHCAMMCFMRDTFSKTLGLLLLLLLNYLKNKLQIFFTFDFFSKSTILTQWLKELEGSMPHSRGLSNNPF